MPGPPTWRTWCQLPRLSVLPGSPTLHLSRRLAPLDAIFLRLDLLVLLVVAFLPFPTQLVGDALQHTDAEHVAVTVYGLTLPGHPRPGVPRWLSMRDVSTSTRPPGEGEEPPGEQRKLLPVVIGYAIAIIIGLLLPGVAVALYFGIAIYLGCAVPGGRTAAIPAFIGAARFPENKALTCGYGGGLGGTRTPKLLDP